MNRKPNLKVDFIAYIIVQILLLIDASFAIWHKEFLDEYAIFGFYGANIGIAIVVYRYIKKLEKERESDVD